MQRLFVLLVLWLGLSLVPASANAARKIALVIGNDAYVYVPALARAAADARAYRDMLSTKRGFEVIFAENADRATMVGKVGEFLGRIRQGDVAMVVYSGHGVQLDPNDGNTLYLLPTDIPSVDPGAGGAEFFLDSQAVNFARLAEQVALNGAALRVYVLDACRNNPFPARGGRSIGMSRGLGRVGASIGEFVFFAAAPGELALDYLPGKDDSPNSVFTRVFLKHFQPGTYLEDIANDVQAEVLELSRQASYNQRPYYSDGVAGKACLDAECGTQAAEPVGAELESSYWGLCERRDALSYCEAYLGQFPDGPHAALARLRIAELRALAAADHGQAVSGAGVAAGSPTTADSTLPSTTESAPGPEAVESATTEISLDRGAPKEIAPPEVEPGAEIAAVNLNASTPTSGRSQQAGSPLPEREQEAERKWGELQDGWDIGALRAFAQDYPDSARRSDADSRVAFLRESHGEAQTELNRLGYNAGPVDGDWGRRSAAALRAFQADRGLPRTGAVDPEVLAMLKTATPRIAARGQTQSASAEQPTTGRSATAPSANTSPTTEPAPQVAAIRPSGSIELIVTSEFRRADSTCPTPTRSSPIRVELDPAATPAHGSTGWLRFRVRVRGENAERRLVIQALSPHAGEDSVSFPLKKIEAGSEMLKYTSIRLPAHTACGTINLYVRKR